MILVFFNIAIFGEIFGFWLRPSTQPLRMFSYGVSPWDLDPQFTMVSKIAAMVEYQYSTTELYS